VEPPRETWDHRGEGRKRKSALKKQTLEKSYINLNNSKKDVDNGLGGEGMVQRSVNGVVGGKCGEKIRRNLSPIIVLTTQGRTQRREAYHHS